METMNANDHAKARNPIHRPTRAHNPSRKFKELCPHCGGKGVTYSSRDMGDRFFDPDDAYVCDRCGGTGYVDEA